MVFLRITKKQRRNTPNQRKNTNIITSSFRLVLSEIVCKCLPVDPAELQLPATSALARLQPASPLPAPLCAYVRARVPTVCACGAVINSLRASVRARLSACARACSVTGSTAQAGVDRYEPD